MNYSSSTPTLPSQPRPFRSKRSRAKQSSAKATTPSRVPSAQNSVPVERENNSVVIVMSLILVAGIALIGYGFYAILGM